MSKRNRSYPQEFINESVNYALKAPSVSGASKELGIPEATLHGWINKAKSQGEVIDSSGKGIDISKVMKELRDLRKKVNLLEQEKSILKKAATYFAKELG